MARTPNAKPPAPVVANGHDASADVEVIEGDGASVEVVEAQPGHEQEAVDPGIAEMRRQLDEANARADAATAERDRLAGERRQDATEIADNRLLVIDSTISTKETEKREWTAKKIAAKEAGDYQAEVDADDHLQGLNIDLRQAKLGKARLSHEIEEAKAGDGQQQEPGADGDPVERFIRENNTHPKAATWLRNHRDYAVGDPQKNNELVRSHHAALGRGLVMNSDAYFKALEEELGMRQPEEETTETRPAPHVAATPSAPVTRTSAPGGGRTIAEGIVELAPGKYRVSAEVKEAAAMSGVTITEYIEEAKKLVRGSDGQLH